MDIVSDSYIDEILHKIIKRWHTGEKIVISDDSSLRGDLDLDSLRTMETCIECENKFKIKITNFEIVNCRTYGDLKKLITSKLDNH